MFKKIAVILLTAGLLQGCIPIIAGGIAAAAVVYIHDQRSTPQKQADDNLRQLIEKKLSAPVFRDECHLVVSVFNGRVLLAGQTPTDELRQQAQRIALTAPGVIKLFNEISVEAPNSTLSRVSDNWINTKIRLDLANRSDLKSATMQVTTTDGIVYLMGQATPQQGKEMISVVRQIAGVQQVVDVLEYDDDSVDD